jgi:hypothetical protein
VEAAVAIRKKEIAEVGDRGTDETRVAQLMSNARVVINFILRLIVRAYVLNSFAV